MALFGKSPSAKEGSNKEGSKKEVPQSKTPTRDVFSHYGGRLTGKQLKDRVSRIYMRPQEKEYIKRVMERYDTKPYSRGITREEFHKGLDEMLKNTRDPIDRQKLERLKKHFEK